MASLALNAFEPCRGTAWQTMNSIAFKNIDSGAPGEKLSTCKHYTGESLAFFNELHEFVHSIGLARSTTLVCNISNSDFVTKYQIIL
jgi:hypothetical protein